MAEYVLGIDLGTSNSVVAAMRDGQPQVLTDADHRNTQPSIVSFHPSGSILVGHDAKRRRLIDPANTITSVKRLIGRPFSAPEVGEFVARCPYRVVEGSNQQTIIEVRDQRLSVPEVSALVLHHMKIIAERVLRQTVRKAVVTVPANFNDAQRAATVAAGQIAGIEVLRIINEPTAAALAYGHGKSLDRTVLVYDYGGGTFDVTILEIHGDVYEVRATAGDTYLGGDDIDERVMERMVALFLEQHRYDLRHDEMAVHRLRSVAEQVKCQLSSQARSVVEVQEIAHGPNGAALDLHFEMTRPEFDALAQDHVDRTFAICDQAFQIAQMPINQIDEVVLVGGTTRIPLVRESVRSYFARAPLVSINPDEVVALGAAIQGAALLEDVAPAPAPAVSASPGAGVGAAVAPAPPKPRPLLLDVTPLSLGVGVVGGFAKVLIPRNAQVPVEQTEVFSTGADNQTAVSIRICQGEARMFDGNTELGELVLAGLRPAPRGEVKVAVTFEIDTNGILKVRARDEATDTEQDATIKLLGELGEHEMRGAIERGTGGVMT
ncbi:MAG: Hsp70 family protein [bacterium]